MAVERPWLALCRPFRVNGLGKTALWSCWATISGNQTFLSLYRQPRALTIENSLMSGCGLSHDPVQLDHSYQTARRNATLVGWLFLPSGKNVLGVTIWYLQGF